MLRRERRPELAGRRHDRRETMANTHRRLLLLIVVVSPFKVKIVLYRR
jgi:hypothetical protein